MTTPSKSCEPRDISLKSLFLGPQAENGEWVRNQISFIFNRWFEWRRKIFPEDGQAISPQDQMTAEFISREQVFTHAISDLLQRFEQEVPKFSPRYIGHMLSEISLPALLGHIIALLHNPNNISGESSKIGVKIEDEAVDALLSMIGYSPQLGAGHFTSGGTVANFEALIRARARCALWLSLGCMIGKESGSDLSLFEFCHMGWQKFDELIRQSGQSPFPFHQLSSWNFTEGNPWEVAKKYRERFGANALEFKGPIVLVPQNKHYSWPKGVSVLGLGDEALWPIQVNERGSLSLLSLQQNLERAQQEGRPVLMVVSVAGTTEMGVFDEIDKVQAVLDEWKKNRDIHIWHHVDAAYGGFFCTLDRHDTELLNPLVAHAIDAIPKSESVTIDPHKLGYVPYSSGAFLAQSRRDYYVKGFHAPYIQYEMTKDRGPFTLEGSRSAAGAAATWMTAKTIGLNRDGYGRILARTIRNRKRLESKLQISKIPIRIAPFAHTNILCFSVAHDGEKLSHSNERTEKIYKAFSTEGKGKFFVSKTSLCWKAYSNYLDQFVANWMAEIDTSELVLIRITLMNPFFGSAQTSIDHEQEFIRCLEGVVEAIESRRL